MMKFSPDTAPHAGSSKTLFGFWAYLMTDCILFATLFATFVVLRGTSTTDFRELFDLKFVFAETMILLTSSLTSGLALLAAHQHKAQHALMLLSITALLGLAFLAMEVSEFITLLHEGYSWTTNGALSAFFTLVGTHGLHILIGIIWLCALIPRLLSRGINSVNLKRLSLFGYFWHFLDLVWIFIFTIVYLGSATL